MPLTKPRPVSTGARTPGSHLGWIRVVFKRTGGMDPALADPVALFIQCLDENGVVASILFAARLSC